FGAATAMMLGGYANAALGADGRLHLVAIDGGPLGAYGSANQRVLYSTPGRTVVVSRRDEMIPFYFANPSIAVDSRRRWIYIAYVRGGRDAVWDIVLAASKDGGQTWTRTRIGDDPACAIHMVPNLAVDTTTGTLHVAWYDSRAGMPAHSGGRFARATCGAGLAKCTQVGRIDDEPFGALSTVRGHGGWIGDAASIVVDEKRRALHAVWTRPGSDVRVVHAKAKLPLR
ncbi:MAG TPA: hypothetical protein VFO79_14625, partial [Xanthomonadales bacterium]|nr:hypothetical protein [Xanthomonadales bacterium]